MKTQRSVGFKIGVVTCALHVAFVLLAVMACKQAQSSTAGLVFLPFFYLDAPVRVLQGFLPGSANSFSPLISFGVLGSGLWFAIPWLVDRLLLRLAARISRVKRWVVVLVLLPLFVVAFIPLGDFAASRSIRQERPDELSASLGAPSSEELNEKVIFDDQVLGGVSSIHHLAGPPQAEPGILLAHHRGVVFLNDRYEEQDRTEFPNMYFQTVNPVPAGDTGEIRFVVYKHFQYAALLDQEGAELWRIERDEGEGVLPMDGVQSGDIDGDGHPEFAVYYRYRTGIVLVDEHGSERWRHNVYALGHLAMHDVRGNGRQEIIYSLSNNANHKTVFTILDADGEVVREWRIATDSYEFDLVNWPDEEGGPHLVLTEENLIRVVDMEGNTVRELDAPGCRSFGKMNAVPLRLRKNEAPGLAVRKILHPDLETLFVYNAGGVLIFQRTDVRRGSMQPSLAAVPAGEKGVQKLLVGTTRDKQVRVLEYSPITPGN